MDIYRDLYRLAHRAIAKLERVPARHGIGGTWLGQRMSEGWECSGTPRHLICECANRPIGGYRPSPQRAGCQGRPWGKDLLNTSA